MFCKNCGKEIDDSAVVCPNCGVATEKMAQSQPVASQKNTMALVGFIFSFFSSVIGLILSIVGLVNSKKPEYNGDGRGLAIAGIILSCISTAFYIIIFVVVLGSGLAGAAGMI